MPWATFSAWWTTVWGALPQPLNSPANSLVGGARRHRPAAPPMAWASDVERSWPAVVAEYLVAYRPNWSRRTSLAWQAQAFASAPASARQPLAETLQPALSQALAAVPATQDPSIPRWAACAAGLLDSNLGARQPAPGHRRPAGNLSGNVRTGAVRL